MSQNKSKTIGDSELREIIEEWPEFPHLELAELKDLGAKWGLGHFSLYKMKPSFRWGYVARLSPTSRLSKLKMSFPDLTIDGFAVIFRQFETPDDPEHAPDYFCGWVKPDREADLDGWIQFLNDEIARLVGRPAA